MSASFSSLVASPTDSATTPSGSAQPTCLNVPPGRHDYVPPYACNAVWNYDVSFPAAMAFSVMFGIVTIAHLTLGIGFRKRFTWVIIMGCSWELASFILRAFSALHQLNIAFATVSQILVLLAPLWINAFVYMTLSRIIYFYIPSKSCLGIPATRLAKLFVWLDVISFIIQLAGGVLIQPGQEPRVLNIGIKIYESGVGVQELFVLVFCGVAGRFHWHMLKMEREEKEKVKPRWRMMLYTCYVVLALITIRIIYRLVELNAGVSTDGSNPLIFHEGYFYGLEATPMLLATALLAILHPGYALKGEDSDFPSVSRKEKKAIKKEEKQRKKEEKQLKKEEREERKRQEKQEKERQTEVKWGTVQVV